MKGRRTWPISDFSAKNGPARELLTLRDSFRAFLYKIKVVEGPEDSYQDALVRCTLLFYYRRLTL